MCEVKFSGRAWKNVKSVVEASAYGIWSRELRDYLEMCFGRVSHVKLLFDDPQFNCVVSVTKGYWNQCPELRDKQVKSYLKSLDMLTWTEGTPPRFDLYLTDEGCRINPQRESE